MNDEDKKKFIEEFKEAEGAKKLEKMMEEELKKAES